MLSTDPLNMPYCSPNKHDGSFKPRAAPATWGVPFKPRAAPATWGFANPYVDLVSTRGPRPIRALPSRKLGAFKAFVKKSPLCSLVSFLTTRQRPKGFQSSEVSSLSFPRDVLNERGRYRIAGEYPLATDMMQAALSSNTSISMGFRSNLDNKICAGTPSPCNHVNTFQPHMYGALCSLVS